MEVVDRCQSNNKHATRVSIWRSLSRLNPCSSHVRPFLTSESPRISCLTQNRVFYVSCHTSSWALFCGLESSQRLVFSHRFCVSGCLINSQRENFYSFFLFRKLSVGGSAIRISADRRRRGSRRDGDGERQKFSQLCGKIVRKEVGNDTNPTPAEQRYSWKCMLPVEEELETGSSQTDYEHHRLLAVGEQR